MVISEEQSAVIAALQNKLNDCIAYNRKVAIQFEQFHMDMRNTIYPDIAVINSTDLEISCNNFELQIHLDEVQDFDIIMEAEDSFTIQADNIEIYFDFIGGMELG